MKHVIHSQLLARMTADAINYAAANRSDPFAFDRCMTHIRVGLCHTRQDGTDGHYKATPHVEMRPSPAKDGTEYPVTVYRNIERV